MGSVYDDNSSLKLHILSSFQIQQRFTSQFINYYTISRTVK